MKNKKRFATLFLPLFLAVSLLVWLVGDIIKEEKKTENLWLVEAESVQRDIPETVLTDMETMKGLEKAWIILEKEVRVQVENYYLDTTIQGVDLETFPLTVVASAGKKNQGTIPLLAVGEDFFSELKDDREKSVSKRQREILRENLDTLELKLEISSGEKEEEFSQKEETSGEILGLVKGNGFYMETEQMKQWLNAQGTSGERKKVLLQIRGDHRAKQAENSLTKAGFQVEARLFGENGSNTVK